MRDLAVTFMSEHIKAMCLIKIIRMAVEVDYLTKYFLVFSYISLHSEIVTIQVDSAFYSLKLKIE